MTGTAAALASWATGLEPTEEDLALAERSLRDTVAVAYAARDHPLRQLFNLLPDAGHWAALAHVLDFDDLHLPSTTHVSAVCVPAALASGGGARAYLAGAGVMARLGSALGWKHYTAGWHATCTAGAPAAAVAAAIARGLDADATATAMALAIPGAGGVQRAFGTAAKSLQVGFAVDAGLRAAALAEAGASADPLALDQWIELVGGGRLAVEHAAAAVPDGLAIKLYPCCYALQRPIAAIRQLPNLAAREVGKVHITTPASSLKPLIHSRPTTGLEGKFSLEYAVAATLLDGRPDLESFTDEAVQRPEARRLMELVEVSQTAGGDGLLDGSVRVQVTLCDGQTRSTTLARPPGSPDRPPADEELIQKLASCAGGQAADINRLDWDSAPGFLRAKL
jgi:2-methylcitrate dehydratase PrpD